MTLPLLALLLAAPDAGFVCAPPVCRTFKTAQAAFAQVLETKPSVLGIGEYHELEGAPKVRSALKRFTVDLLPLLDGKAGALVAETWMTTGKCGATEKKAVQEVKKVTQRPDTTEDELSVMLEKAFDHGLKNHILLLTCADYQALMDEDGHLDAEKSLLLVRKLVAEKALEVMEKGEAGPGQKLLVLYGGAVHNDVAPLPDYTAYAFGPQLSQVTDGGYVELDLLVPEYVAQDDDLPKEPWFAPAMKLAAQGKTVLVSPRPDAHFLFFPRTPLRK